jgi:hypothetical protein
MISPVDNNLEYTNGAVRIRPTQLGFPAELTGAWEASGTGTGYPWKRLYLLNTSVVDPTLQAVGLYAVTPDNDESLAVGTRGWMEPDAGGAGWYFQPEQAPGSGIFGQDSATPGGIMIWNDDTGQWAGEASGLVFRRNQTSGNSLTARGTNQHLVHTLPTLPLPFIANSNTLAPNTLCQTLSIWDQERGGSAIFPGVVGTSDKELSLFFTGRFGFNFWGNSAFFEAGKLIATVEYFYFNDAANAGEIRSYVTSSNVVRIHSSINNWMAHYSSNGTAGVTGTLKAGATATEGVITNLGTLTSAYTTTNVTTDRSYDANATTLDEIADVLGTLIADLKAKSILG